MAWDLLERTDVQGCRDLEYAAIAVGAELGERVTHPTWRRYFEGQEWYRPRAFIWTPVARENRDWLEAAACRCRVERPEVSPRIRRRVERWFARLAAGRLRLPRRVYADGQPSTPGDVRRLLTRGHLPPLTPRTAVVPAEGAAPGGPGTVSVLVGAPDLSCVGDEDEACEGLVFVELTFDARGLVTAVNVGAVACPFVYVVTSGGEVRVAPILVGRSRPSLVGVDTVPLPPCAEGGPLWVELREEDPETTHIEAVWLEVDGRRLDPVEGRGPVVLRRGEVLRLRFDGLRRGAARLSLVARGHYEPGGARRAR